MELHEQFEKVDIMDDIIADMEERILDAENDRDKMVARRDAFVKQRNLGWYYDVSTDTT